MKGATGVVITGHGNLDDPYLVNIDAGKTTVDDTPTVNMTISGTGTSAAWYHIRADATLHLDDLLDADARNPANGNVLAYNSTTGQWSPVPPVTATPGAINTGNGMTGDGSAATPLTARANPAAGIAVDGNGIGLQSGILAALADTGWVTTGYTRLAGAKTITAFAIRSIGKIVEVYASGTLASAIPSTPTGDYGNILLFSVPAAFRPGAYGAGLPTSASGPSFGFSIYGNTGNVYLTNGPNNVGFAAGTPWSVTGMYMKD